MAEDVVVEVVKLESLAIDVREKERREPGTRKSKMEVLLVYKSIGSRKIQIAKTNMWQILLILGKARSLVFMMWYIAITYLIQMFLPSFIMAQAW